MGYGCYNSVQEVQTLIYDFVLKHMKYCTIYVTVFLFVNILQQARLHVNNMPLML